MRGQSVGKWAPNWKTTHNASKVANQNAFCAEFEHIFERSQVRVYVDEQNLKGFGRFRPEKDQKRIEQVLRAILECYINENGPPPKYIEARQVAGLRDLQFVFATRRA